MKKIYILIFLLMTVHAFAQPPAGSWNLVWEDNFDGNSLDSKKWKLGLHWLGIGGNHLFANSGKSISVDNGLLTIRAEKKNGIFAGITKEYISSEISTFNFFRQKYGYFEARIKYDAIQGMWPAFWMMPNRGIPTQSDWYQDAETYIKFDISAISSPINSAKFKVKVMPQTEVTSDQNVSVHKIIDNSLWKEGTINWTNKPAYNPAFLKQFTGTTNVNLINQITIGEYIEVDVKEYINGEITKGNNFVGFALMDKFMKQKRVEFGSKENAEIGNRPVLVIDGTSIYPSDDAIVKIKNPNNGFGSSPRLLVCGRWANTSKTSDGGMEMDILESLGVWGDNQTAQTLHWDNYGANHKSATSGRLTLTPTNDGFHTYGMEWSEGELKFYIDGGLTWTHTDPRVSTVDSYIILSHQVGGWNGSGNTPVADASLPADMVIDYVKVYKNTTLAVDTFDKYGRSLAIAPNPIKDGNLTFALIAYSATENIKVTITDVLGRVLYSSSITLNSKGEIIIPLEKMNIKKGIYLLQVNGENLNLAKKFIY